VLCEADRFLGSQGGVVEAAEVRNQPPAAALLADGVEQGAGLDRVGDPSPVDTVGGLGRKVACLRPITLLPFSVDASPQHSILIRRSPAAASGWSSPRMMGRPSHLTRSRDSGGGASEPMRVAATPLRRSMASGLLTTLAVPTHRKSLDPGGSGSFGGSSGCSRTLLAELASPRVRVLQPVPGSYSAWASMSRRRKSGQLLKRLDDALLTDW